MAAFEKMELPELEMHEMPEGRGSGTRGRGMGGGRRRGGETF
jgi:hypothetical protein